MSSAWSRKRRSVVAVVAGIVAIIAATTVVDLVLHAAGVFPPVGIPIDEAQSLIALSYRVVITIAGAYLTARLAPAAPMKHALILGIAGTVLGTVGVLATLGKGLGPAWYPIALPLLAIPECLAGGKLRELQTRAPLARA